MSIGIVPTRFRLTNWQILHLILLTTISLGIGWLARGIGRPPLVTCAGSTGKVNNKLTLRLAADFSEDQRRLLITEQHLQSDSSGSWFTFKQTNMIGYSLETGREVFKAELKDGQAYFTDKQDRLYIHQTGMIHLGLLDAQTGGLTLREIEIEPVSKIAVAPNGTRIAGLTANHRGQISLVDSNGKLLRQIPTHEIGYSPDRVLLKLTWTPDSNYLVVIDEASQRREVYVFDGTSGQRLNHITIKIPYANREHKLDFTEGWSDQHSLVLSTEYTTGRNPNLPTTFKQVAILSDAGVVSAPETRLLIGEKPAGTMRFRSEMDGTTLCMQEGNLVGKMFDSIDQFMHGLGATKTWLAWSKAWRESASVAIVRHHASDPRTPIARAWFSDPNVLISPNTRYVAGVQKTNGHEQIVVYALQPIMPNWVWQTIVSLSAFAFLMAATSIQSLVKVSRTLKGRKAESS